MSWTANKGEIDKMSRRDLVDYLEGSRGMMCRPEETKQELKECALEDAGYKKQQNGRWSKQKG